jgi:hypothetical protein
MRRRLTLVGISLAVAAFAAVTNLARATTITYTVDGVAAQQFPSSVTPPTNAPWGTNGYPGDTVEIQAYTNTFDLVAGITTQKINTLLWIVNYTYGGTATDPNQWSDLDFYPNASRNMTIGSQTQAFTQLGSLHVTWFTDYLSFSAGSTASFTIDGYEVDVTPLAVPSSSAGGSGNPPWVQPPQDMMAQFTVTQIPEPATFRITDIGIEGEDVRVTWTTMGSVKTNALQVAAGDVSGSFTNNFTDLFTVTNTIGSLTNYLDSGGATNTPSRYYRVRLVP